MIKVYSTNQIRDAERKAIDGGVSEDELIERASKKLCEEVLNVKGNNVAIFAGGGNNGSDALSLALLLRDLRNVTVYTCSNHRNIYNENRLKKINSFGAIVRPMEECDLSDTDVVIDGIFGIGLTRNIEGELKTVIEKINESKAYVIAVDVPSGLNADTGKVMGVAVEADKTVTFSGIKQGLIISHGRNYSGEIVVADIGFEASEADSEIVEAEDIKLPKRKTVSHKGNYGNVKIIAGSPTMIGASILAHESALSALRSGAGYATLCVPESLISVYQTRIKEELLFIMPDIVGKITYNERILDEIMTKTSSIVIGMGLGKNFDIIKIISYLAKNFDGTLVIDGDGLNALSENISAINDHKAKIILTPHAGEFIRLYGDYDKPDVEAVKEFSKKIGGVVAMKSATTIICDGEKIYLNTTGSPAMAKAGSGDVLAGMIGAFSATVDPLTATLRGCFAFGKAGERAEKIRGSYSVLASDIISEI
ncbi:MAG: NAD(P)H-hydrate dehydratase [Clostridia bacterium]|nr:NAD(P)H-hydrate dehydratase [Clostridia bacterium]